MGLAQTTQTATEEGMVWYDINVCTRMLMLNAKKHTNTFNILFLLAIDADQYLLICKLKACISYFHHYTNRKSFANVIFSKISTS